MLHMSEMQLLGKGEDSCACARYDDAKACAVMLPRMKHVRENVGHWKPSVSKIIVAGREDQNVLFDLRIVVTAWFMFG